MPQLRLRRPGRPRLTLRSRLVAGFAVVLLLMAVVVAIAVDRLHAIDASAARINGRALTTVSLVGDMSAGVERLRMEQHRQLLSRDKARHATLIATVRTSVDRASDRYWAQIQTPAEHATWQHVENLWNLYLRRSTFAQRASESGDLVQAEKVLDDTDPLFGRLATALERWKASADAQGREIAADAHTGYRHARTLVIVLLIASLLVVIVIAVLLTRWIDRRIGAILGRVSQLRDGDAASLRDALRALAGGDLTVSVAPTLEADARVSGDELGQLAGAVDSVRASTAQTMLAYDEARAEIAQMIGRVSQTATSVAAASNQVADTSQEAGRAVTEIAGAVGEVAHGAERQVHMVLDTRESAQRTSEIAQTARATAASGAVAAQEAAEAMTAVRDASTEVSAAVSSLAAKSDQIGGIVTVITAIAEQTNLLALNAAIEAARAGDHGRGFAVVAEEVRKLAEESRRAARSIADLVGEIQGDTASGLELVQAGAERSERGVEIVDQARAAFLQIVDAIEAVGTQIAEIVAATNEVAAVAEQSSASAEEVSASTQQTSASTQQIAATAQQLSADAQQLEELIGVFRLQGVDGAER
jgi:methyl-accepting chemotaxis protein